jgi:tRNA modification GTPase
LLGEERAIVTPIPGTTRDSIEDRLSIAGLAVRIWDTAGLLEATSTRTPDEVERLGIERSRKRLESADLALLVLDPTAGVQQQAAIFSEAIGKAPRVLLAMNKVDILSEVEREALLEKYAAVTGLRPLSISALREAGLDTLREAVGSMLLADGPRTTAVLISNRRHLDALQEAKSALERALAGISRDDPAEFTSLELRAALTALREIVGVTSTEDVLGLIFSRFCIGK